jgi:dynein heavy chain
LPKPYSLLKLWIHEMNRVYRDRLIETSDETQFDQIV